MTVPVTAAVASAGSEPDASGGRWRSAFHDAWRHVTWRDAGWAMSVALAFVLANAYALNIATGRSWPIPVRSYEWTSVPLSLIFLVAFRMAEHERFGDVATWRRYAAAILAAGLLYWTAQTVAVFLSTEVHNMPSMGEGLVWSALHVLMISVIVAVVYSTLARSRRAQAAFDAAALQRAATRRQVTEARLSALQAKVDPRFLFGTLELVETLYDREPDSAERTLAAMIDFLRTALPSGVDEGSNVAREVRMVRDYLDIAAVRMGSRLRFRIDVPPEIESARCPAMVLVPVVEDAIAGGLEPMPHGGDIAVEARRRDERLVVTVAHTGVAHMPSAAWLQALRDRLVELYGDDQRLEVSGQAGGSVTTLEVPYETARGSANAVPRDTPTGVPA